MSAPPPPPPPYQARETIIDPLPPLEQKTDTLSAADLLRLYDDRIHKLGHSISWFDNQIRKTSKELDSIRINHPCRRGEIAALSAELGRINEHVTHLHSCQRLLLIQGRTSVLRLATQDTFGVGTEDQMQFRGIEEGGRGCVCQLL
jgi:hypothetical protein